MILKPPADLTSSGGLFFRNATQLALSSCHYVGLCNIFYLIYVQVKMYVQRHVHEYSKTNHLY